jgi:hypothetical protein
VIEHYIDGLGAHREEVTERIRRAILEETRLGTYETLLGQVAGRRLSDKKS